MPHFKSSIRTPDGFLNFYFNRIQTAVGSCYHLSTVGRNGMAIIFHMEEECGKWIVRRNAEMPAWVIDFEEQLSQKITEHVVKHSRKAGLD